MNESIRLGVLLFILVLGNNALPATAQQAVVKLQWDAPTAGPAPEGYRMYRGASCDALSPLNALNAPITRLTYDDTTVARGQAYCYKVSSVKGTEESTGRSNAVTVTIPDPTQAPGNLVCTFEVGQGGGVVTGACVAQ